MPTSSSSSGDDSDRALVRDFLRTGSEGAFRHLYRVHTPALYGFALRLTRGNEDIAQDVVQDTWVRAVDKLESFRWRAGLRTWLHSIALNVHREGLRRHALRERKRDEIERRFTVVRGAEEPPPLDLESAVRELPDGQREVLLLHDIEGYTHKEIAALMDIAEGTSKSQLFKARAALRDWLESRGASRHAG